MKKAFIAFGLLIASMSTVMAQAPAKRLALPANLAKYVDQYPVEADEGPGGKEQTQDAARETLQ
jgi:hypothetical protein